MENDKVVPPVQADHAEVKPPPVELRNSLWCRDKTGKVGMIGEINGSEVTFHYLEAEGALGPPVKLQLETLAIARAADLPAHLNFTAEQLRDFGYR